MSAVFNHALRRYISMTVPRNVAGPSAGEHSGGYKVWKRLSFFVAFPCVGVCMLNTYLKHQEEHAHHERPPFVKYDYLVRREKRFPWGDGTRSLFHNPHANPLPDGYEA